MNRENLQRAADYIRTIPQERFNMGVYRDALPGQDEQPENEFDHECKTVGCVIGHCTILDKGNALPMGPNSRWINYTDWSFKFFGPLSQEEWDWCFDYNWKDRDNTPEGAALRIEWLLKHGLPVDWRDHRSCKAPLCYLNPSQP